MEMNDLTDIQLPDISALVAFGKLGVAVLASRMLSLVSLGGVVALSAYVAYSPSWQGAACVGIVAVFVFVPALKAESRFRSPDEPPQG